MTNLKFLLTVTVAFMLSFTVNAQRLPDNNEKPLLTFACLSDIHTERSMVEVSNLDNIYLRGSVQMTLERLRQEENIDLLVLGGDMTSDASITQTQWEATRSLIGESMKQAFPIGATKFPVLYVSGNHEYESAKNKSYNSGDYYTYPMKDDIGELPADECFYENTDTWPSFSLLAAYHYQLNGFDFVVLNCGKYFFANSSNYQYSTPSVQWVAQKLAQIYAEDPDKTVFFLVHVPFRDSNSIRSESKGMNNSESTTLLKTTLAKYPNLIMLYGHDHGENNSYSREKSSQRVTRYDKNGNKISTTDARHVDGPYFQTTNVPETPAVPEMVEIPQSQGIDIDPDFAHATLVEGSDYNTYTCTQDYQIALKMLNINVEGYDYILVKFAEPVAAGWNIAFWGNRSTVAIPQGTTEYKFNLESSMRTTLPEITLMTMVGGYSAPLTAKIVGVYKCRNTSSTAKARRAPVMRASAISYENLECNIVSNKTGSYLGHDGNNLGPVSTLYPLTLNLENASSSKFSINVPNKGYVYSGSNGRFSCNNTKQDMYLFKVQDPNASSIVATKCSAPTPGSTYLIVVLNGNGSYYALTSTQYLSSSGHRMDGKVVTINNDQISLTGDNQDIMWTINFEGGEPEEEPVYLNTNNALCYVISSKTGQYLGVDAYNLAAVDNSQQMRLNLEDQNSSRFSLSVTQSCSEANGNYIVSGSSGRYSCNSSNEPLYLFKIVDPTASTIVANKCNNPTDGGTYLIVARNKNDNSKYYALTCDHYTSGNRMLGEQVTISNDKITLTGDHQNLMWIISSNEEGGGDEPVVEPVYIDCNNASCYFTSYKTGQYLGVDTYNLAAVSSSQETILNLESESEGYFSLYVTQSCSESTGGHYVYYSAGSGRFSCNTNKQNFYLFKVEDPAASTIVANKCTTPTDGDTYVLVVRNNNNYYALTCDHASNANRMLGQQVTVTNDQITLTSDNTNLLWTINTVNGGGDTPVTPPVVEDTGSFFSAFMGSMRYYYNTIDPGDMPIETPNIVQAMIVYVFKDRVVLQMKNYNRYGTINGITVNQYLQSYTAYRTVTVPEVTVAISNTGETGDSIHALKGSTLDQLDIPEPQNGEFEFVGWTNQSEISSSQEPTVLDDDYTFSTNETLYAVYKYPMGGTSQYGYTLGKGYTVTISNVGWASFFANDAVEADYDFDIYTATLNDKTFTLHNTSSEVIPANTPVVINGTPGKYGFLVTDETATMPDNQLSGTAVKAPYSDLLNGDDSYYVYTLNNGSTGIGFYKMKDTSSLAANRAYLLVPKSVFDNEVKGLAFNIAEDENEEVNNIANINVNKSIDSMYDLQGRKINGDINSLSSGLYIINNKKTYITK